MTDKTCPSKEFKSVFNMQVNSLQKLTHTMNYPLVAKACEIIFLIVIYFKAC